MIKQLKHLFLLQGDYMIITAKKITLFFSVLFFSFITILPVFGDLYFDELEGQSSMKGKKGLLEQIKLTEELFLDYDQEMYRDAEYRALYSAQIEFYHTRRAYFIGLLYEKYKSARELEELLPKRWESSTYVWGMEFEYEIVWYAVKYPKRKDEISNGWFYFARSAIWKNYNNPDPIHMAVDSFLSKYPGHEKEFDLLKFAVQYLGDHPSSKNYSDRLAELDPNSPEGRQARMRQNEGKLFKFDFIDVITGKRITSASLKGKVVVIDFWATWCGPCIAEVPNMKKLYAKYKALGVEFIGISLDSNVSTMKKYCEDNDIPWPQYCEEGKAWDTVLSSSWGIQSIPTVFILDKEGRIASVEVRGRLEQLIPELLK